MMEKEYREIKEEVIKDVICNKCGKSCKTSFGFEYAQLSVSWGYDSSHDGLMYNAELCEECFDEFIKSFIIKIDPILYLND